MNLVGIVDGRRVPGNRVSVTVLPVLSAVSLTANPTSPEVKQSVEFRAALQPENAQAEYQFNWGDGATSKWSTSANQTHVYTTSGTHSALVMARAAKTSVQSAALEIAVHDKPAALAPEKSTDNTGSQKPPPGGNNPAPTPEPLPLRHLPPLSLKVANPSVKPGDSVQVAGSFGAAEQSGAEYKFIFGDGTPAVWSRTPVVMHQFQNAGAYSVYVLGRIRSPEYEPKEKASNALIISVSSPAPSQQTPWGKLAVAFLFALGMAATTWRTFVRVKVRVKPPPAPELRVTSGPVPVPEIRVRVVLGEVTHDTARYKEAVNKR